MDFKKKKLKTDPIEKNGSIFSGIKKESNSTNFTNVQHPYFVLKKRNRVIAMVFVFFATMIIGIIGAGVFAQISGFRITLNVPDFVGRVIPFIDTTSNKGPEKYNILLTGVGGEGHEGTDLTDTIILASINRTHNTVSLLSIPRDLYIDFPTKGRGKINETYIRALKGSNSEMAMKTFEEKITEITGEKIDAYLNVDFAGFSKFVDALGGVMIDVPEDLIDTEYPDNNWGYQTFRIRKGEQLLDGETALKYARSRHSTSDFDRSIRQQLVIRAVKDRLLSMGVLTSPTKLKGLYLAVMDHIKTDLTMSEIASLALFAKDLPSDHILSFNLNDSCIQSASLCSIGSFLYTPAREDFGGLSVLLPDGATPGRISTYKNIQLFTNLIFNSPEIYLKKEEIYLVNATKQSGLANKFALKLKRFGFNVPEKNSILSTKDAYSGSVVYHVFNEASGEGIPKDSETLQALSLFIPVPIVQEEESKYSKLLGPKIEIILANDAQKFLP